MSELAIRFTAPGVAALVETAPDSSQLGPNEVGGRTVATLISTGTELAGYLRVTRPYSPGYAAVFEVTEVGAEVRRVQIGDLALTMGPHRSWQRAPEDQVLPVPEGLPPPQATFTRLMGVTMSTLTTTVARPPELVLVTGLGLVGHLGARLFQSCGYDVIAVDPDERRRVYALGGGLSRVLSAVPLDDPDVAGKVSLVLECSGHEQAALDGCNVVRQRGEVVQVATPWVRRTDLMAHDLLHAVFHRYVVLRSGWEWELPMQPEEFRANSIHGNLAAALRWLAEGRLDVSGLYVSTLPRDAQEAYQALLHNRNERLATVFDWSGEA